MHALSVTDNAIGGGALLPAALVLAEEAAATGVGEGHFIASCWVPGVLAGLRSACARKNFALNLSHLSFPHRKSTWLFRHQHSHP